MNENEEMVDWVTTAGISLASLPRFVTSFAKRINDVDRIRKIIAIVVLIAHLQLTYIRLATNTVFSLKKPSNTSLHKCD